MLREIDRNFEFCMADGSAYSFQVSGRLVEGLEDLGGNLEVHRRLAGVAVLEEDQEVDSAVQTKEDLGKRMLLGIANQLMCNIDRKCQKTFGCWEMPLSFYMAIFQLQIFSA